MASTILLDLMGGVALLLWGLHMVHSGIVRAFGSDLRRTLGAALQKQVCRIFGGSRDHRVRIGGTPVRRQGDSCAPRSSMPNDSVEITKDGKSTGRSSTDRPRWVAIKCGD